MSLSKLFQRIIFHNNTTPAINEDNLNAMSKAIDDIDDRVILIGDDVVTVIPQIQAYLEQAEDLVEAMEELSQNPPYIGANGNWYVFDTTLEAYKDSGVDASITVDIADITMIAVGAQPYVTNSGTNTDPVFHLFLPQSPQGATGNGIANIAKTSTQGLVDTYTITMTDGTTYTFTVTNGQNGSGTGDMLQSDYDSDSTVKNSGGIADYVEGEVSPMLNVLGAKNLLPNTAVSQILGNTTYTVNANGTINANSSAAEADYYNMKVHIFDSFPYDSCVYSISDGGSDEGSLNTYLGYIVDSTASENIAMTPDGGVISGRKGHRLEVYVQIRPGYQAVNHVFYPMIRPASIQDGTYAPYSMTNQQIIPYALSQSNPNLLDNPWFTVNQRGQSSYTGNSSANVYTVDRWYINRYASDVTMTVNNDGTITLTNTGSNDNQQAGQFLEDMLLVSGKTYTLSLDVVSYSGTVRALLAGHNSPYPTIVNKLIDSTGVISKSGTYDGTSNTYKVAISLAANSSITLRAIKLELGSVSTLAQDTAPNYAQELLKCQRYYFKTKVKSGTQYQTSYIARAGDANYIYGVQFPVEMRTEPTISNIVAKDFFNVESAIDSGITAGATKQGIAYFEKQSGFNATYNYYMQFEASADL